MKFPLKIVLTLLVSAWPCAAQAQAVESPARIKIGVILPLSGPFARFGAKIQQAINLYAGEKVEFVFEDEGCEPRPAVAAYNKLARLNKINLFIGPFCGSPQEALAPIVKAEKKLVLLGSSAPQGVFAKSGGRMFSTQHSIEAESTFLARELNALQIAKLIIIFNDTQFSRAHEAAFRAHYKGEILETFALNTAAVSELKTVALRSKKLQPQAFYVPDAFVVISGLLKELAAAGLRDKPIYSVYPMQSQDVIEAAGAAAENIVYSYPDIGPEDALHHYPALAARLMTEAAIDCNEDLECARKRLTQKNRFDEFGTLVGTLTLKTIRNGKFVAYSAP